MVEIIASRKAKLKEVTALVRTVFIGAYCEYDNKAQKLRIECRRGPTFQDLERLSIALGTDQIDIGAEQDEGSCPMCSNSPETVLHVTWSEVGT